MGLPGTTIDYSPTDYDPQKQFQILRYNGTRMEPVGRLIKKSGPWVWSRVWKSLRIVIPLRTGERSPPKSVPGHEQ